MARKTCAYLSTRSIRKGERRQAGQERTDAAWSRAFIRGFIIKSSSTEEQKRALCGLTVSDARGVE